MAGDSSQWVVEVWSVAMVRAVTWGTLGVLAAGLADRWLGGGAPRLCSWVWRGAHVKLLLLLTGLGGVALPGFDLPDLEWRTADPPAWTAAGRGSGPGEPVTGPAPSLAESGRPAGNAAGYRSDPLLLAAGFWLLGFGWNAVGLIRAGFLASALVRGVRPLEDPRVGGWLARWRADAESDSPGRRRWTRRLRVGVHDGVASPRLVGVLRPTVLLPAHGGDLGGENGLRSVLEHELRHAQGRDLFWRWLRSWLRAVLFFHPLVAWSDRRATMAEERACDQAALCRVPLPAAEYGRMLLRWVEAEVRQNHGGEPRVVVGMSRHAENLAERLRALGTGPCRVTWRRGACLALVLAVALPLGWISRPTQRDIQQLDPRFRVLGFQVSRGVGHMLRVHRESLRFFGLRLHRDHQATTAGTAPAGTSLASRLARGLQRVGLQPDFRASTYSLGFAGLVDGYAFFVRFESSASPSANPPGRLRAELVDEQGETIPLLEREGMDHAVPTAGETVRVWTLEPAPRSPGRFRLSLVEEGGAEAVRIHLGTLGGNQ